MSLFRKVRPSSGRSVRLLIVGAGEAGQALVREIQEHKLPVHPVAFLDDGPGLIGTEICGLPVIGGTDHLEEAARQVKAEEVLLAIPSGEGPLVRRLVIQCKRAGLPFRLVPGLREIILGEVRFDQISDVLPEHLLGRESVDFDFPTARQLVAGQSVMVTGAGGSIGSELCRRLLPLEPVELILLGRGENSLFEIESELAVRSGATRLTTVVADVRDSKRLDVLAGRLRPGLILHAAAHKHVPMMEENPEEAVQVNVVGTVNLIRFAETVAAQRLVMISTDKAVHPTSVMGATKQLAEMAVREAASGAGPRLMVVRFGNVLGSRGSVVPFFQSRIAAGLPLPVTHPDMTRYFMTIKEAALLVIEAMVLGERGATYILEMGQPISILELAKNLLALSGYDPVGGDDGPGIEFTELRPGERLHEMLHEEDERLVPSPNPLIHQAVATGRAEGVVLEHVPRLVDLADTGQQEELRRFMAHLLGRPEISQPNGDQRN